MSETKLSPRERVREALERVLDCAGTFEERVAPEQLAADRATLEMAFGLAALDVAGEPVAKPAAWILRHKHAPSLQPYTGLRGRPDAALEPRRVDRHGPLRTRGRAMSAGERVPFLNEVMRFDEAIVKVAEMLEVEGHRRENNPSLAATYESAFHFGFVSSWLRTLQGGQEK